MINIFEDNLFVEAAADSFKLFKQESLELLAQEKCWTAKVSQYFSKALTMADSDIEGPNQLYRRLLRLPLSTRLTIT